MNEVNPKQYMQQSRHDDGKMTRKEAIKVLNGILHLNYRNFWDEECDDAIDMAIEALQTIDNCDQCEWCCPSDGTPTIHVVRCKDCKHHSVKGENTFFGWCGSWNRPTSEMRFCSKGERIKESEVEK